MYWINVLFTCLWPSTHPKQMIRWNYIYKGKRLFNLNGNKVKELQELQVGMKHIVSYSD